MSTPDRLRVIEQWLQQADEELLYEPDGEAVDEQSTETTAAPERRVLALPYRRGYGRHPIAQPVRFSSPAFLTTDPSEFACCETLLDARVETPEGQPCVCGAMWYRYVAARGQV
jgi:hypothetical protein